MESKKKPIVASALAVIAAVVVIVSAAVLAAPAQKASVAPDIPAGVDAPPRTPFFLVGFTRDQSGAILGGCAVNITDKTTGESNNTTVSDSVTGFYSCDVNNGLASGVSGGQVMNVTAFNGPLRGTNQSALPLVLGAFSQINVTLTIFVIPEFPFALIPVGALLGGVAFMAAMGRREQET